MLPIARAHALAAENNENALPRSASRLRRDSSTRIGVMTRPPPAPVSAPATMSRAVVGGRVSTSTAAPVAASPVMIEEDRADPVGQPTGRHARQQDRDAVGDEEEPDVRAGGLGPLREERDDDAPVGDVEQVDGDQRRPRAPEREAEAAPGDVGRGVRVGARLTARSEAERDDVDDREAGEHEGDGHQRDPMQ